MLAVSTSQHSTSQREDMSQHETDSDVHEEHGSLCRTCSSCMSEKPAGSAWVPCVAAQGRLSRSPGVEC